MKPSPPRPKTRHSNCPFCRVQTSTTNVDLFYCVECLIHFDHNSTGKINVIRYAVHNKHATINSVIMRNDLAKTYLNYKDPKYANGHLVKEFSGVWLDTHPDDILDLIARLEKLTAFA